MVKLTKCFHKPSNPNDPKMKKKTSYKHPPPKEGINVEVRDEGAEVQHYDDVNVAGLDNEDFPLPTPFLNFHTRSSEGEEGLVMQGDSSIIEINVAQGMLNDVILPEDLVKYTEVSSKNLSTPYREILYKVRFL